MKLLSVADPNKGVPGIGVPTFVKKFAQGIKITVSG
jgi:hypothetical protein